MEAIAPQKQQRQRPQTTKSTRSTIDVLSKKFGESPKCGEFLQRLTSYFQSFSASVVGTSLEGISPKYSEFNTSNSLEIFQIRGYKTQEGAIAFLSKPQYHC